MIIIPELELVLITPPRTGSTMLSQQVAAKYPQSFRPYRHMEACGVPFGYDRWHRVGVFRPPIDRLWSVYHYCKSVAISDRGTPEWREKLRRSVEVPFDRWLVENMIPFTDPFDSAGMGYWPRYAVRCPLPENRKSLFTYLRPDLGTAIHMLRAVVDHLGLDSTARVNASGRPPVPNFDQLDHEARAHLQAFFGWDLRAFFGRDTEGAAA